MKSKYYVGNLKNDSLNGNHHGWFVGTFMEHTPQKTTKVEIKYWEFKKGKTTHPTKVSSTLEVTIILTGQIKAIIDNKRMVLKEGQYAVITPGTMNNLAYEIIQKSSGLTIKAPSDPSAKKVI